MGFVKDIFGGGDDDVQEAPQEAAGVQAQYQKEALDYLKEINKLPQQYKEEALTKLAGVYGLPGGEGSQQELIDRARSSPLYESIMGTRDLGEEAILRNASATGGLRSGNLQSAMYDYNTQLANQALLESYNKELAGLTGLTGLATNEQQIAANMAGIGQTYAQGIIGEAQSRAAGQQSSFNNLLGLGQLGIGIAGLFV